MLCLSNGCAKQDLPNGTAKNEILTMHPVDPDKTMVTVHYEHGAADFLDLETMIETAFPDVDIVMVHAGATDAAYPLRQSLLNGVARDILLARDVPCILDIAPDYLLDLSSQSFVRNYYAASLDSCMNEEGKLYYLPGPSDIYGVVYDCTLFAENGWEPPHSYSEFVSLVDTINRAGKKAVETEDGEEQEVPFKALQPALLFPDAFQIVFNTFAYDRVYRGAENQQWLLNYQNGKESMVGHMEPAAAILKQLFEDGILSPADMGIRPRYRSRKLYQYHSTAMIFENQNAYTTNAAISTEDIWHEVGIFPFWTSDEPDSDYLYAIPSYFFAINKASAEESPAKKQLLLDILAFLSQPETQKKLIRDGLQFSHVTGIPMVIGDFGKEIQNTIQEGRIINHFFLSGDDAVVEAKMRDTVLDWLSGELTTEGWLREADAARDESLTGTEDMPVYGEAVRTFTKWETAELVGDMYRHETGAPIALVFVSSNSEGVNGFLYEGDITDQSLQCISATKSYSDTSRGVATGQLTGQQIIDYLSGKEGAVAGTEDHIAASGLLIDYSPWKEPGQRLLRCRLPDGKELDPDGLYTVAYCVNSLKKVNDHTMEPAQIPHEKIWSGTWEEHFISWLSDIGKKVTGPEFPAVLAWETD